MNIFKKLLKQKIDLIFLYYIITILDISNFCQKDYFIF